MFYTLRSPDQAVLRWPAGPMALGPRVCVFVHWDGAGEVREYVLLYLRALREAGLSVLFVSNAERLRPDSLAAVQAHCVGVIVRRNVGYDFGAWREGIAALDLPQPGIKELYLANDSVYGPLAPMDRVIDQFDFSEADMWGCTETWQSRYHLQSYFLGFSARVLAHPAWQAFWANVRPANKQWVVYHYEVGLSQALLKAGFRLRSVWSYQRLVRDVDEARALDQRFEEDGLGHDADAAFGHVGFALRLPEQGRIPAPHFGGLVFPGDGIPGAGERRELRQLQA